MRNAGRMIFCTLAMMAFFVYFAAAEVRGEEREDGGLREIKVESEVLFAGGEEYEPDRRHEDENGAVYELKDWRMEPAVLESRVRTVRREVTYEHLEGAGLIPETASITEWDDQTGQSITGQYPVLDVKMSGERWTANFTFPVTFHTYDAQVYRLGEKTIPLDEERPALEGCEAELLDIIGVDPNSYRITEMEWAGTPYLDVDGILCRDAVARGEKKVADYVVAYGGIMVFPEASGMKCVAVYKEKRSGRKPAQDVKILSETVEGLGPEAGYDWLIMREGFMITVAIGAVIFILIFVFWLMKWLRKRKRREENMDCDTVRKSGKRTVIMVLVLLGAVVVMTLLTSNTVWASEGWKLTAEGTWQYEEEGAGIRHGWSWIDGSWYYFNGNGEMETGWNCLQGVWYFLNPVSDGGKGRMMTGWQWVDGYCYYLEEMERGVYPLGGMYAAGMGADGHTGAIADKRLTGNTSDGNKGGVTPDGYRVNKDGRWVLENGGEVYVEGKGIRSVGNLNLKSGRRGGGSSSGGSSSGGSSSGGSSSGGDNSGGGDSEGNSGGDRGETGSEGSTESGGGVGEEPAEPVLEYAYTIRYEDVEKHTVLYVVTGKKEADYVVSVDDRDVVGYKVCEGQQKEFILSFNDMVVTVYYEKIKTASPSDAKPVSWNVYFVQRDEYSNEIFPVQTGRSDEGTELVIDFPEVLVGRDGYEYSSLKSSPCMLVVTGTGQQKYYIEYERGSKIPEESGEEVGMEKRKKWLDIAGRVDQLITGNLPLEQQLISGDQEESTRRLKNLISMVDDKKRHEVYLIGRNHVPSSVAAGLEFPDVAGISEVVLDSFYVDGAEYTVVRVGFYRAFSELACCHEWTETDCVLAGCVSSGHGTFSCGKCGKEETVIYPAMGHADSDKNGRCDVCEEMILEDTGREEGYFQIGDVMMQTIGGRQYLFRCIEEDYSDDKDNNQALALFLCDSVIRSDVDSSLSDFQKMIFGGNNNYKRSNVRRWLNQNTGDGLWAAHASYVGCNTAYDGATGKGLYEQFDETNLRSFEKPFQLMEDSIFILSVEEAVRYGDYLWRFDGSDENNPGSQVSAYSKGYYLRTPQYEESDGKFQYGNGIYAVDVVNGNIRPVDVWDTSIGIRPVITVSQS